MVILYTSILLFKNITDNKLITILSFNCLNFLFPFFRIPKNYIDYKITKTMIMIILNY